MFAGDNSLCSEITKQFKLEITPKTGTFTQTKYSLNKDGIGEKPARIYEVDELRQRPLTSKKMNSILAQDIDDLDDEIKVFHAGTKESPTGGLLTNGGRVLTLSCLNQSIGEARHKIYSNVQHVQFKGVYYRTDIAKDI